MESHTTERLFEAFIVLCITLQLSILALNGIIDGANAFIGLIGVAAGLGYYQRKKTVTE